MDKLTNALEVIAALTLMAIIVAGTWLLLGWVVLGAVEVWIRIVGLLF